MDCLFNPMSCIEGMLEMLSLFVQEAAMENIVTKIFNDLYIHNLIKPAL